ncbi:hypothetical protein PFMC_00046 [Plasmodium falciparum CAMP/Malaysia]|uniref:Uncharacterized protein n=1 Tax=Plasmodium falciparum (isolate Camp / Malaysia) TaxID=5835 RepID=A0A024XEQ6_PLAFC|nr:hypothetical protein PFMC_00046 [Plasmodium falciparum CAMP/Malaysia]
MYFIQIFYHLKKSSKVHFNIKYIHKSSKLCVKKK